MIKIPRALTVGATLVAVIYLAVCGLLYLSQRSYIYYPTNRSADTPTVTLNRDDAQVLVSTNGADSDRGVLYFGGNAEDVSQAIGVLNRAFPDAAIYAMHYRSYGGSTGTPSEQALVSDGMALFDRVARQHPRISIIGRSLGSGIAVQVAASKPVERLVLVTPYNSLLELAAERFKLFPTRLLLQDKYESWRYVSQLQMPTTIIIAGHDRIIPNDSSRRLAAAFPAGVVSVIEIAGVDHNSLSNSPEYVAALAGRDEPGNDR
ncbi:MAG TPA: alpha/beta hydrolase [Lysobacter sp.]|nr:alpha/beta hydrolase [Lysobacter sp.]